MARLTRSDYALPADELAPALLGCTLVRVLADGTRLGGRIVETEAYLAPEDQASHARNGHRSARVEAMYAKPGSAYVYLTRGVHFLFNVACLREGSAHAVLVRAVEPLGDDAALARMHTNRVAGAMAVRRAMPSTVGRPKPVFRHRDLGSGPAKLTQSLAIRPSHNGLDLTCPTKHAPDPGPVWIEGVPGAIPDKEIVNDARIGVDSVGPPWAGAPLRWSVLGNEHVSVRPRKS